MSYFDMYSPYASQAANQYGIPEDLFFGLIQTESSWNPYASPGTTSAYGFTQLTSGTAQQLGVNSHDPISNIFGGAKYLASMPGSDWATKLAHYYQGPGASIGSSGIAYAGKVLNAAQKFIDSPLGKTAEALGLAAATGGASLGMTGIPGMGGSQSDWVQEIKDWILKSGFFQRIALALVALILILGAIYTLKGKSL